MQHRKIKLLTLHSKPHKDSSDVYRTTHKMQKTIQLTRVDPPRWMMSNRNPLPMSFDKFCLLKKKIKEKSSLLSQSSGRFFFLVFQGRKREENEDQRRNGGVELIVTRDKSSSVCVTSTARTQ